MATKQPMKPSETAASLVEAVEASLRARLHSEPGVAAVDIAAALADFQRASVALVATVTAHAPTDLGAPFVLEYVRGQAQKEADICVDNALARAQMRLSAAKEHFRAAVDVARRQQARRPA